MGIYVYSFWLPVGNKVNERGSVAVSILPVVILIHLDDLDHVSAYDLMNECDRKKKRREMTCCVGGRLGVVVFGVELKLK